MNQLVAAGRAVVETPHGPEVRAVLPCSIGES